MHNILFIVQISIMISAYKKDSRLLIFLVLISWIWLDISFQTYRHLLNGNIEAQEPCTKHMLRKHTTCEQLLSRDGGTIGAAVYACLISSSGSLSIPLNSLSCLPF